MDRGMFACVCMYVCGLYSKVDHARVQKPRKKGIFHREARSARAVFVVSKTAEIKKNGMFFRLIKIMQYLLFTYYKYPISVYLHVHCLDTMNLNWQKQVFFMVFCFILPWNFTSRYLWLEYDFGPLSLIRVWFVFEFKKCYFRIWKTCQNMGFFFESSQDSPGQFLGAIVKHDTHLWIQVPPGVGSGEGDLGATSKPNRWLTTGSVQFQAVVIV